MSVNSYLEKLSSDLVLNINEKNSIKTSIETLESRLNYHFNDIIERFCFGSYTRGTILPRKGDEQSDIDYMIVFNNDNEYTPQTFLRRLREFAIKYYSTSDIHQSYPTMVLKLNHIKFELIPAYNAGGLYSNDYKIPAPNNEYEKWTSTDPNGFNKNLTNANINNNNKIKPMIRLIKYWNTRNNHVYSSYSLEQHLIGYSYSYLSNNLKDYFYEGVEGLATWNLSQTSADKVNKLKEKVNKIKQSETGGFFYTAESEIKELLPNIN
ncbi:SMODS domain-containing nucleotidyltransferase [Clostridium estertheticum]|uniref:SMODS domain-containing nucleotidyltransferase n=1 Tax=Clostridium estertheticum TaxID=238834 RepID=UPI001C7E0BC3|nr:nucleotidyltransferase domain-containing protein [Clostridium estertheticum]MBX4268446.1 nucleotidyltransferase domain-containing protein [Clostridium estertheticum]WLC81494.1 nucleotidyltransferase domain-containing protein [Clostridium estertheticum]